MNKKEALKRAQDLAEDGEIDEAYTLSDYWLKKNPNDVGFLTVLCSIMSDARKDIIAYQLATRCTQLIPNNAAAWINKGRTANQLWLEKESERAYNKALKLTQTPAQAYMILTNIAALLIDIGEYKKAEVYCHDAIELAKDSKLDDGKGRANLGFCQLAQQNWAEGWKNYHKALGHVADWRPKKSYGSEPAWDGTKNKTVVVYGEQGLGDEISFASVVPDMVKHSKKVILDVDSRLEGLFKRSFPKAVVYGTRREKVLNWKEKDRDINYSFPIGQLGEYFRLKDSDFPGRPYLKSCPDRTKMWKALFKTKKKPTVTQHFNGGTAMDGKKAYLFCQFFNVI